MTIKTRFCPSPTGLMHLGNARTALFNALLARKETGIFLVRIEDTDQSRSQSNYTEQLLDDLQWLGLQWQEGVTCGGENGPYSQSERQTIYDKYYDVLKDKNLIYPCFCTSEQLMLHQKIQRASGIAPRYAGTCRHLSTEEIQHKREQGLQANLRFKVPEATPIVFHDLVRGKQSFYSNDVGDFIIRRTDGTAPFLYSNAIDDALMGVTHALRGEDHLSNTPRQLLILQALDLNPPQYGHLALILGHDGSPLSKRNGSRSIDDLRREAYLPRAIVNYLARLGHHYAQDDCMSLHDLSQHFDLTHLNRAAAKFDEQQLGHFQKLAILNSDTETLKAWLADTLKEVSTEHSNAFIELIKANIMFPKDAQLWANALFADQLIYNDEAEQALRDAGSSFFEHALQLAHQKNMDYATLTQSLKKELEVKGKALFRPLRFALTGQAHGPELSPMFNLMGLEHIAKRFQQAIGKLA